MEAEEGYFRMVYLAKGAVLEDVFSRIERFLKR